MTARTLRIQIARRTDGGSVLRCERPDGSMTWQRQEGRQAEFFPLHDLTHYAVERTLGIRQAFYGLIGAGWDVDDTTGKGRRGPLPDPALFVESLVGLLDGERAGGVRWTAAEFNQQIGSYLARSGRRPALILDDEQLTRIRTERNAAIERWRAVPPGGTLEIDFPLAPSEQAP